MKADFGMISKAGTTYLRFGATWTKTTKRGQTTYYTSTMSMLQFNPSVKKEMPLFHTLYA